MRLLEAIHRRFGLPAELPAEVQAEIKRADRIAAFYEATKLAGFGLEEARAFFGDPAELAIQPAIIAEKLWPMAADEAQRSFLARFQNLADALAF